jgi:hypothetical protein
MKKKLGKLVAWLVAAGWEINIGPHDRVAGYYARVYVTQDLEECRDCKRPLLGYWHEYGHGFTPLEALENGLRIAQTGSPHHTYDPHHFTKGNDE